MMFCHSKNNDSGAKGCPVACAIKCLAIIANILLLAAVAYIMTQAYGRDTTLALLLAVPPLLSIIALKSGPDAEERALMRQLRKARLKHELAALESNK